VKEKTVPVLNAMRIPIILLAVSLLFWHCGGPTGGDDKPLIRISPGALDFGETSNSLVLTIDNVGTGVLRWLIAAPSDEWITATPASGSIVNTPMTIDVRVDREKAPVGQHEVKLVVTGGGESYEITVKATIKDQTPILLLDPTTLDFGEASNSLLLTVSNAGGGSLHWSMATPSEGWIFLSRREGNITREPLQVDVRIDRENAPIGRQEVKLAVTSAEGGRQEITLIAMITEPVLAVAPTELHFDATVLSKSLLIRNEGTGALDWSVEAPETWLQVSPQKGRVVDQDGVVTVSVDRSLVEENGTYAGEIVIISDAGSVRVPVTMVVEGKVSAPQLRVSPLSLSFGTTSSKKTIGISNGGGGDLSWQVSSPQAWISLSPESGAILSGALPAQVTVEVDRSQLPPGEHTGSVDVISNGGSSAVPIIVSVPTPLLSLSTRNIDFRTDLETFNLEIANTGNGELTWAVSSDLPWLQIEPSAGTTGQVATPVVLSVQRQGLEAGTYEGKVRITSNSTSEPTIELRVKMQTLERPVLAVKPDSLDFGTDQTELSLEIANGNNGTLVWQARGSEDWLTPATSSGEVRQFGKETVGFTVKREGLLAGVHEAQIIITSNGGNRNVPVRMEVLQAPRLTIDQDRLDFGAVSVMQELILRNTGTGQLTWSVQEEVGWCQVSQTEGSLLGGMETVMVEVDRTGLSAGDYAGSLVVQGDDGNDSIELNVVMTVLANIAPVANAGLDQSVKVGATVQLDGRGSRDADEDLLTFRWNAPSGIVLDTNMASTPTFVAGAPGTYRFQLTVNDGTSNSSPDEVVVTVTAPEPTTGDAQIIGEVTENNEGDVQIVGEVIEEEKGDAQIVGEVKD
jgi:hypothetical protein